MISISEKDGAVDFTVRVVTRASRSEVVGEIGDAIKVKLTAPPVEGAANAELIRLLAGHFGVPKSGIEIVSGQSSRTKKIRIAGLTAAKLLNAVGSADLPPEKSA